MASKKVSYSYPYPRPSVTVDLVAFTFRESGLHVLLVTRKKSPFKGRKALPGGFLNLEEESGQAAARETEEETGLCLKGPIYELAFYSAVQRDPRGRTISLAYLALIRPPSPVPKGGDDAASAAWYPLNQLNLSSLAFDHAEILHDAIDWLVHSPAETMALLRLLPEVFAVRDVQALFRAFGVPITRASRWCETMEENCLVGRLPGRKRYYRSLLVDATEFIRSEFKG